MSCIAKAANKNTTYGGPDDFVSAKSMKHMNEALMEKIREGIDLISRLKAGLKEANEENEKLKAVLDKMEHDKWERDTTIKMNRLERELEERLLLEELNEQEDRSEGGTTTERTADGEEETVRP
jgi:hypothetical protein